MSTAEVFAPTWSTWMMICPESGSVRPWIADGSLDARMRGFRRPPAVEYEVCGGVQTAGVERRAVDRLGRHRARRRAVGAARRVVAHGAEEPAVEARLDAVERVARGWRARGAAAAALEQDEPAQLLVARVGGAEAGQVEVGRRIARDEAGARRVAAEEDVVVLDGQVRRLHHRVDVLREHQVRPVGEERHVGLRVVEDRPPAEARQRRAERHADLAAEEPVERDLGVAELLRDLDAGAVLELVRAPVERPHLDGQALLARHADDQVLGEDLEAAGAALEAGHQDQDRVGRDAGAAARGSACSARCSG